MEDDMRKRIISGTILVAVITVLIIFGGIYFGTFMLLASLVSVYELARACKVHKEEGIENAQGYTNIADLGDVNAKTKDKKKIKLPGCNILEVIAYIETIGIYAVITYYGGVLAKDHAVPVSGLAGKLTSGDATLAVVIAFILVILGIYVITYPKYDIRQVMSIVFIGIYAPLMISFIYRIRVEEPYGMIMAFLVIITASGSDTSAYFVGSNLGKHKLAPILSPKKSVEGAIGGVIGAALLNTVFALALCAFDVFEVRYIAIFAIIGAVGSVISQIGDLAASAIKRSFDIKDYGNIIPGHGGVMDRLDSILVVAPIIYLMVKLFG